MDKQNNVVMYDSDEAAKLITVTGWFSRDGRFYGDNEGLARWAGCTHKVCECGKEMSKTYTRCADCRHLSVIERYNALAEVAYNGQYVYSEFDHNYYYDEDTIRDAAHYAEIPASEMLLVVCEPQDLDQFDPDSFWVDVLPEDQSADDAVDPNVLSAAKALNDAIRNSKRVVSWYPGKTRTTLKAKD